MMQREGETLLVRGRKNSLAAHRSDEAEVMDRARKAEEEPQGHMVTALRHKTRRRSSCKSDHLSLIIVWSVADRRGRREGEQRGMWLSHGVLSDQRLSCAASWPIHAGIVAARPISRPPM